MPTTTSKWNPRFARYAEMQGRSPEDQLDHDREAWPGGCMAGFILWCSANLRAFREASPQSFTAHSGALVDQEAYDAFLATTTIQPESGPVEKQQLARTPPA